MERVAPDNGRTAVDLATSPAFSLGELQIFPALRRVDRDGETQELEPKVMSVLVALSRVRPNVASRDQLIDECWDGRAVSDDALNRCILSLRKLSHGLGNSCFAIETVPRVGYYLRELQDPPEDLEDGGRTLKLLGRLPGRATTLTLGLLAATLILLLAAVMIGRWQDDNRPASIAVLPFRDLVEGQSYFAEGLGEEIFARLGREQGLTVLGRSSAGSIASQDGDMLGAARALGVDYLLEGSVRSQGNEVRIATSLIRTSDGVEIWSESYEGGLDDTFAIQDRIGSSVVRRLQNRFALRKAIPVVRPANSEAYKMYLTAVGIIRTRDRNLGNAAVDLLNQVLRLDPEFAPAWARLSEATRLAGYAVGPQAAVASDIRAEAQARRAVQLAPQLAEGHAALGVVLGFGSEEAQFHLRRAAELDPDNPEILVWRGVGHKAAGEFAEELESYRRAHELDPLWFRPLRDLIIATADRGDRAKAEALIGDGPGGDEVARHMALGRVAWSYGDFSESLRHWRVAEAKKSPRWSKTAREGVATTRYLVGIANRPHSASIRPVADLRRSMTISWMDAAPSADQWRLRNRNAAAERFYHQDNLYAAKLMLVADRSAELVATFDGPIGLLGIRRGVALRADQLADVPVVALALRAEGRAPEATELLKQAEALVQRIKSRGWVPIWFDAMAAEIFATGGKAGRAVDALERAYRRGWRQIYSNGPRDLGDEPAFAGLRTDARFRTMLRAIAEDRARERREIAQLTT